MVATLLLSYMVMAHGYSVIKEMFLDSFAEVFCDAGFAVLAYDKRNEALDGSEHSLKALAYARELSQKHDSMLILLHELRPHNRRIRKWQ